MPIDLAPLRDSLFSQVTIIVAIISVVLIIAALMSQNMARVFAFAAIGILIVALIFAFKNISDLGEWLSKTIFKIGYISMPTSTDFINSIAQIFT
ncbi:hypothetical protein HCJ25_14035 [Listeria sp. FSL L7-1426]|uniref:hypothetical protein n=1 Tax=Listeria cossartiae TaxID=2838249 RepID=UPI001624D7B0|nr:hypothetical protein [Listeria cossartiae]MBC1572764.1 hypothetical protein [Listeria cossartiae subsp. cossartiae]